MPDTEPTASASKGKAVARRPDNAPILYNEMCRAIEAAHRVDEVKDIRDKALAIEIYSRQARNTEAEQMACEVRLRAERKWGKLRKTEVVPAHRPGKVSSDTTVNSQRKLRELGVTKDQSANWQKMADVPEEQFEEAVRKPKATTAGIGKIAEAAKPKPINPVDDGALWLWGRLQDFQRLHKLLDRDPNAVVAGMLPHMQETVRDLAPTIAAWLGRIK